MIGCLLVKIQSDQEHNSVSLIKQEITEKLNFVNVMVKDEWIVAYGNIDSRISIWQLALELEVKGEIVGYGFGLDCESVRKDLLQMLNKRGVMSNMEYQALIIQ